MVFLHDVPGPYTVGATTFARQVSPAFAVGNAKFRQKEPALQLEEVAFTAYYPAGLRSAGKAKTWKGLDWVLRPLNASLRGYAYFAGVSTWVLWPFVYMFGALVKIPVQTNAPLFSPDHADSKGHGEFASKQWPLAIFSHGLGGSRTSYSQICSRLAAAGHVVLAMEHRDGTGPVCVLRSRTADGTRTKEKLYIKGVDIGLPPGSGDKEFLPFRLDQLKFRRHEIYIAYTAFRKLVEGAASDLETIDGKDIDWKSWTSGPGTSPVRCNEDVRLVGHSFGGATVFSILSNGPPADDYPVLPVTKALVHDPWLDPLPSPGPARYVPPSAVSPTALDSKNDDGKDSHARLLIVNSEVFTLWSEHFTRLKEVVDAWEPDGKSLITLVQSQHAHFSDFYLLPLIRRKLAEILMDIIGSISLGFLDSKLDATLESLPTIQMEAKLTGKKTKYGTAERKLVGKPGEIIVH